MLTLPTSWLELLRRELVIQLGYPMVSGEYQRIRDKQVLPMYKFTCQLATLEPPPPATQQLFGAIYGNRRQWTASCG
jgi:hypothetical protein